jgi:hypothetical protein
MNKTQKVIAVTGYVAAFVMALAMFVQSYLKTNPVPATAPAPTTVQTTK